MKRLFDIFFSLTALIILFPFFLVIALLIKFGSKGEIFFLQKRVGKDFKEFSIIKFRTMKAGADNKGLLTVGERDLRITPVGYHLRKYKLDELPQFINILKGEMSVVGPRPEVKKYVDLYSDVQKKILSVKPGMTDYASIAFSNENEILSQHENAEDVYVKSIMPEKIKMGLKYIQERSFAEDLKILWLTFQKIFYSCKKEKAVNTK